MPSGPPGGSAAAAPPYTEPSGRPRWLPVVATVLAAAAVVLGLGFGNVIPGFHLGGGSYPSGGGHVKTPAPRSFSVTFTESGLASGTPWTVAFAGGSQSSVGTSIGFVSGNGTFPYSVTPIAGYRFSPEAGSIAVDGKNLTEPTTFTPYFPSSFAVRFTEGGLPASTAWSVALNGQLETSTGPSISFSEMNGTFLYSVSPVGGFSVNPASGSLIVAGFVLAQSVTFTPSHSAGPYPITFTETGLTAGTSWTVTLGSTPSSSTATSIAFPETNGSYVYEVATVPGYIESPSVGPVTVRGGPVAIAVLFTNSSLPPNDSEFPVTFLTAGLPANAQWGILILPGPAPYLYNSTEFGVGAEGTPIVVGLPNGTYAWFLSYNPVSYAPATVNGSVTVAGHPINRTISFASIVATSASFPATFSETGLPAGGTWYVSVNGTMKSGRTGSPVGFPLLNGSYLFNVSASAYGYASSDQYGTLVVHGAPATVSVPFAPVYNVTFIETGVPSSGGWEVDLNGSFAEVSAGSPIAYTMFNGTYSFTTFSPGSTAMPAGGSVQVAGHPNTVPITFHATPSFPVRIVESGLPNGTFWIAQLQLDGSPFANGTFGSGTTAIVSVPDGNYTWSVQAESFNLSYLAAPASGGLTIRGSGVQVNVSFAAVPAGLQVVLFSEQDALYTGFHGVPNGTSWNVTLGGTTQTTTGLLIDFLEPNGTFDYSIGGPAGYIALPAFGTFTINATLPSAPGTPAATVFVAFVPGTPAPPPVGPGDPGVDHSTAGKDAATPALPGRSASPSRG